MHSWNHEFARPSAKGRRGRQSLPVTNTTAMTATPPAAARYSGEHQFHTLPRRGRARKAKVTREGDDRPGAAMFDRLFSSLPLSSTKTTTQVKSESDEEPNEEPFPSASYRAIEAERSLSRSVFPSGGLPDYDGDADEISILGVESTPDPVRHRLTPDRSFDEVSMKMESPANLSIGKLFDEFEETSVKVSPSSIRAASLHSTGEDVAGVLDSIVDQVTEVAGDVAVLPEDEPAIEQLADVADPEQSIAPTSTPHETTHKMTAEFHDSEAQVISHTPDKLHEHLPFAGVDFFNTPARPIEDVNSHELHISTLIMSKAPSTPKRSPLYKEDAFVDSPITPDRAAVVAAAVMDIEPNVPLADDSFASTLVDFANDPAIVPVRPKKNQGGGSTSEDADPDRSMIDSANGDVTPAPIGSSPHTQDNQEETRSEQSRRSPQQLESAIKLQQSSHEFRVDECQIDQDRPLIVRASTLTLSSPRETRQEATPASFTPKPDLRPTTPHSSQRRYMDIPLSRQDPTIELWQNPNSILRPPRNRSPSPNLEQLEGRQTPPPRARQSMDVPLSRSDEPEEIWHAAGPNAQRRPRRTLLSPEPRSRSRHSSQLMVEESPKIQQSPQAGEASSSERATTTTTTSTGMPVIPKLDFGTGLKVVHARSLSEDDDIAVQPEEHASPNNFILMEEVVRGETSSPESVSRRQKIHSSAHATPRVSKLRRLARTLEQSLDRHLSPQEDEIEPTSPEMTPRTARRKELSDDIVLDFTETNEQQEQGTGLGQDEGQEGENEQEVTEEQHGTVDTNPAEAVTPEPEMETKVEPLTSTIATPVFTLKRKRAGGSTPAGTESENGPASDDRRSRKRGTRRTSRAEENLATFGIVPEVLSRTRRERKKPTEYWKISMTATREPEVKDSSVKETRIEQAKPGSKPVKNKLPTADRKSPSLSPPPPAVESQTNSKVAKNKRKKRPSDIIGPVSSRHKIVAPSWATNKTKEKTGTTATKQAKVYNFEDSE